MLVAISGPSSSGKGTLLYDLESAGYQVIQLQYARRLLKAYNTSVTELYQKSLAEIKEFHSQLLEFKAECEAGFIGSHSLVLVERTFLDFYVYLTTQTQHVDLEFYLKCFNKTNEFYKGIVFLSQCPVVEDDGIRIVNEEKINTQKALFTTIWSDPIFTNKLLVVSETERQERTNKVINYLQGL